MTEIVRNKTTTLLVDLAGACAGHHDGHVRNLDVRVCTHNEIWNFVGAKGRNATPEKKKVDGLGRYLDMDCAGADTKLCVSYLVGGRDRRWATCGCRSARAHVSQLLSHPSDIPRWKGASGVLARYASCWVSKLCQVTLFGHI
jgi:hypothetical protein